MFCPQRGLDGQKETTAVSPSFENGVSSRGAWSEVTPVQLGKLEETEERLRFQMVKVFFSLEKTENVGKTKNNTICTSFYYSLCRIDSG